MERKLRIEALSDLLLNCAGLYLWVYDSNMHLIGSDCPHEAVIELLFPSFHGPGSADGSNPPDTPVLYSNDISLMWITLAQYDADEFVRLFVVGPFFHESYSAQSVDARIEKLRLDEENRRAISAFVGRLPVFSLARAFEYTQMLYYTIREEQISISNLRYVEFDHHNKPVPREEEIAQAHGTYDAEQEMLRIVREGDIGRFHEHMKRMAVTGTIGKLSNNDSVRQFKNLVLVAVTLFSRAAIEGGLSPELSLTLTDRYFQSIEAAQTLAELSEISHLMQTDFVQRVHQCKMERFSEPIRACCDYIELHLEEKLTLADLAQCAGYTQFYLSRKFKEETGLAPTDYIRNKRLDRAQFLLKTTQQSIQSIGARLQFSSQSHFADCFKRLYGMTPGQYRNP